jgi:hypothetical protein
VWRARCPQVVPKIVVYKSFKIIGNSGRSLELSTCVPRDFVNARGGYLHRAGAGLGRRGHVGLGHRLAKAAGNSDIP